MIAHEHGESLQRLAYVLGTLGWQIVPTQWHRAGGKAANTPIRGVTGGADFVSRDDITRQVAGLRLHLEGGPDCTGDWAKPAIRPPSFVTGLDVDHGYAGKGGGDTLVELEMQLGPLPASWSTTARGQWSPSRRRWYRHPEDLVVLDAAFTEYGGHIETIRTGHRYSWTAPAIHTRKGQVVGPIVWYGPDQEPTSVPHVDELPEFPPAWLDYFRTKATARSHAGPCASGEHGEPGTGRAITPDHADRVLKKMTQRLHDMPPSGGEFRNTVFGLAAVTARHVAGKSGGPQDVMDRMARVFTEHPHGLTMDADDVKWAEEGIAEGWSSPWSLVASQIVPMQGTPTAAEFMGVQDPHTPTGPQVEMPGWWVAHAATEEELDYFLATYTQHSNPGRLGRRASWMRGDLPARLGKHARQLVEDVLAGHYPARDALLALARAYRHHGGTDAADARSLLAAALGAVLTTKVAS